MFKNFFVIGLLGFSVIALTGCTVRTYSMTRDRVDQDLSSGNRGYLKGTAPAETTERPTTREVQVTEIELGRSVKVVRQATPTPAVSEGNRGILPEGRTNEAAVESAVSTPEVSSGAYKEYKVQKGDTLQKISQQYYGTTKKWYKIFKANQDVLSSANKLRPGMTIKLPEAGMTPSSGMKEPAENLK